MISTAKFEERERERESVMGVSYIIGFSDICACKGIIHNLDEWDPFLSFPQLVGSSILVVSCFFPLLFQFWRLGGRKNRHPTYLLLLLLLVLLISTPKDNSTVLERTGPGEMTTTFGSYLDRRWWMTLSLFGSFRSQWPFTNRFLVHCIPNAHLPRAFLVHCGQDPCWYHGKNLKIHLNDF